MAHERILVVDDDEGVRWALDRALAREGYAPVLAATAGAAVAEVEAGGIACVLMDIRMPGGDGLAALRRLREHDPSLPVIMMTAFGSLQAAVEAMKLGAYDYITKPFDFDELAILVRRALEVRSLLDELARLREGLQGRQDQGSLIGSSPAMQAVFKTVGRVASSDLTVLIRGESGTGKELVARAIHLNSRRQRMPFVPVNCAAIPRDLLESDLFGHERGAFTGATAPRRGKFELAQGGTIFLDEVGDMDLALQAKILRALEDRKIERLGGEASLEVDVRIIAATHQDLEARVAQQSFRQDLLYRLAVVPVVLPPLRERREDIPALVEHFLRRAAEEAGGPPKVISDAALQALLDYDWPGNVRELENAIKRACILAPTEIILPEHLPSALPHRAPPGRERTLPLDKILAEGIRAEIRRLGPGGAGKLYAHFLGRVERPLLKYALDLSGGNQLKAAALLGINRNTLRKKLKQHGLLEGKSSIA
jgi:two-component system nitrogen regulation response regulator GlnG